MATPPPQPSSAGFQQAQTGLLIALEAEVTQIYTSQLNVADLRASLPAFKRALMAITRHYGLASQALSLNFYRSERKAAGITKPVRLPAPKAPDPVQLNRGVGWATRVLWNKEPAVDVGLTNTIGVIEKSVLDLGRDSIIDSVHKDTQAEAWARVTEPKPCAFCALLATRGAVYKSEKSAEFEAHDHCRCHAQPVFTGVPHESSAQVREFQALYQAHPGLRNFRRAYDAKYGL